MADPRSETVGLRVLVSPLAQNAYFADHLEVARAELGAHFPDCSVSHERIGSMDFLDLEVADDRLRDLARLSFVQGAFGSGGEGADTPVRPIDLDPGFVLPPELVHGVKYQGKTNELVTQLAINLALRFGPDARAPEDLTLFDPMAGRGTTLLWALRYGMDARGIELAPDAPDALVRHVKKQAKLHRFKHKLSEGFTGRRNKAGDGRFVRFDIEGATLELVTGDSRAAPDHLGKGRCDLLVADLPYGVQHRGSEGKRNPLDTIDGCLPGWLACMRSGGAGVLIFNSYIPKRAQLEAVLGEHGCEVIEFSAPHRMSESIVRDLVVFTWP